MAYGETYRIVAVYRPLGGVTALQTRAPKSLDVVGYDPESGRRTSRRVALAGAEAAIARLVAEHPGASVERYDGGCRVATFTALAR